MISIFQAVRDNNVETVRYLIQRACGVAAPMPALMKDELPLRQNKGAAQKFNINKRSIRGRTALHCAATWNRLEIATMLVECPLVNVNLQDWENGWTALHRALYHGNVAIALVLMQRSDIDLFIKDKEGHLPLELYELSLEPNVFSVLSGQDKTSLYTWGSNTNYMLGHADSENRTYPERVIMPLASSQNTYASQQPAFTIASVHMSKYHMAVLTSESTRNLLVCGFGRGGRLGTGKDADTQFTLTPVPYPERIVAVALGRDHTIAVTESCNVITFGSNAYGQLGYTLEEKTEPMQLVPRKVQAQLLKKQPIVGVAASRIHSVVYTHTEVFTFGCNQGQLGYQPVGDDLYQIIPRKVVLGSRVNQIVATDYATALLFASGDVVLWCNHKHNKVTFPFQRFPSSIQVHTNSTCYVTKLFSNGDSHFGALTNTGDVFVWTCRPTTESRPSETKTRSVVAAVTPPTRIWSSSKAHRAARDAGIGLHGQVILCTVLGQVYVGNTTKENKDTYKFSLVSSLQRCVQVCTSPSGAFAAIRSEMPLPLPSCEAPQLAADLTAALPHIAAQDALACQLDKLHAQWDAAKTDQQAMTDDDQEQEKTSSALTAIDLTFTEKIRQETEAAWATVHGRADGDDTLDVLIVLREKTIYCHSALLACRSGFFARVVAGNTNLSTPMVTVDQQNGRTVIRLDDGFHVEALLLVLDYLYTDMFCHPMSTSSKRSALADASVSNQLIQRDLIALAALFHLPYLEESASFSFGHAFPHTLAMDLEQMLTDKHSQQIKLCLQDGYVLCHEWIVRQRCPFFGNLLAPNSVWMQVRREEQKANAARYLHINMHHVRKELMESLLRYLYTDAEEDILFGRITTTDSETMMHYILDLLCLADELLLPRLKRICERSLVHFLSLRTALLLLEKADHSQAASLKAICLKYMTGNLSMFLTTGMLSLLEPKLIQDLEAYVRQCLAQAMPFVPPRPVLPDTTDDDEFSTSLFTQSREDGPVVSNFMEYLVTLRPEPSPKEPSSRDDEDDGLVFTMEDVKTKKQRKRAQRIPVESNEVGHPVNLNTTDPPVQRQGWGTTFSVGSQEDRPSLRDILEQEQEPKPLASSFTPPKHSPPKRLSQKERRKVMQSETTAPSPAPQPVWGKVPPVTAPLSLKKPNGVVAPAPEPVASGSEHADGSKGKKIFVSKEFLERPVETRRATETPKPSNDFDLSVNMGPCFTLTPVRRRGNAARSAANTPAVVDAQSFQAIQRQQELEDMLVKGKGPKKTLTQIQTEERAMEGLREFYIQTIEIGSGEWFDIRTKRSSMHKPPHD